MCPLQLGPSCARHVQSPRPCLPPPLLPLPRCIMPPDPGMWILSTVFAAAPAARSTSPTLPLAFAGATVSAGVAGGILFTTAHELLHGSAWLDKAAANALLAFTGYMHWTESHLAHHVKASCRSAGGCLAAVLLCVARRACWLIAVAAKVGQIAVASLALTCACLCAACAACCAARCAAEAAS